MYFRFLSAQKYISQLASEVTFLLSCGTPDDRSIPSDGKRLSKDSDGNVKYSKEEKDNQEQRFKTQPIPSPME